MPCKSHGARDRVKLLGDLDGFSHKIFTKDPTTQALFNQAGIFSLSKLDNFPLPCHSPQSVPELMLKWPWPLLQSIHFLLVYLPAGVLKEGREILLRCSPNFFFGAEHAYPRIDVSRALRVFCLLGTSISTRLSAPFCLHRN